MATIIKLKVITSGAVSTGNVDLSNYYTKEEVDNLIPKEYLSEIPSEYVTEDELNAKGYLTEVPNTYALKTDIPDTSNLATKDQVNSITDNVYTKTEIDSMFGTIDNILDNINGEVV